jgi:uncharacterized membrane protein (UPF0127 family)
MSKHKLWTVFVVMAVIRGFAVYAQDQSLPMTTVTIGGLHVKAELAFTDETRAQGLMYRKSMPQDAGMLFLFPSLDQHSFWMKNTLIPLDMIWINDRKEIVYYVTATPCKKDPCDSYVPMQKAQYVLEVNSGFASKHHLKIGDKVEFNIPQDIEDRVTSEIQRIGF